MHELGLLRDLVVIFALALLVVALLRRVGVPTIAGLIVAGVVAGPFGFRLVAEMHGVELLAEVGIVLLLFGIGVELSLDRLRRLWRAILIGGALQVSLTVAGTFVVAHALGATVQQAVFLGFLVAPSSTAIVLRGLQARGETEAPHGAFAIGILVFQDMCVVPMIVILPILGGAGHTGNLALVLLKPLVLLAVVLVLARLVVPKVLHFAALTRQRDIFVLAVFVLCLGTAWAASLAGVSLALGAFLAGLVVAGSDYRHQALSDVIPFREVLTSLFFISVGMLLDPRAVVAEFRPILLLLVGLLASKAIVVGLAARLMGLPARVAVLAGTALAQVGEFAFVLARAGSDDLAPEPARTHLTAAIILSMLITPFAMNLGPRIAAGVARLGAGGHLVKVPGVDQVGGPGSLTDHVVVAGYGLAGAELTASLVLAKIPCVVVDLNANNVEQARKEGAPAFYGDVTSLEVLEHVGIERARAFVVVINDPDAAERAVSAARHHSPTLPILVRARYLLDAPRFRKAGATEIVPAEVEVAAEIARRVLTQCGLDGAVVKDHVARVRAHRPA